MIETFESLYIWMFFLISGIIVNWLYEILIIRRKINNQEYISRIIFFSLICLGILIIFSNIFIKKNIDELKDYEYIILLWSISIILGLLFSIIKKYDLFHLILRKLNLTNVSDNNIDEFIFDHNKENWITFELKNGNVFQGIVDFYDTKKGFSLSLSKVSVLNPKTKKFKETNCDKMYINLKEVLYFYVNYKNLNK
jgi:hypothetical protein